MREQKKCKAEHSDAKGWPWPAAADHTRTNDQSKSINWFQVSTFNPSFPIPFDLNGFLMVSQWLWFGTVHLLSIPNLASGYFVFCEQKRSSRFSIQAYLFPKHNLHHPSNRAVFPYTLFILFPAIVHSEICRLINNEAKPENQPTDQLLTIDRNSTAHNPTMARKIKLHSLFTVYPLRHILLYFSPFLYYIPTLQYVFSESVLY
jgi:hypothetical protein